MFEVHDTFKPNTPFGKIKSPVRVIDTILFEEVVLICIDNNSDSPTAPFRIDYTIWIDLINTNEIEKIPDPYLSLPSIPPRLPNAALKRLHQLTSITARLLENPDFLHTSKKFNSQLCAAAEYLGVSDKTVKRWVCLWLQAGRNPTAVIKKFISPERKAVKKQTTGNKRGPQSIIKGAASSAPAHEVHEKITIAYDNYIAREKLKWSDAYNEMLTCLYNIPEEHIATNNTNPGLLLSPAIVEKYRIPTWMQFRYRCRELKKTRKSELIDLPRGKRGKVRDDVPGPGFYEIDATHFQIQLVSRITKSVLVGRPTVYLIVDVYDGIITGYAVTLENPSWATAALALHNCFSDKDAVFKRLGLPFTSADWPCHHLPTLLRADRAELVSNMGQNFPASGIRVEVTPSMEPIAKGTVEGKHAQIKKPGRFNLPGLFTKKLGRRQSNGKKEAALDIFVFERILVEIIMDLNGSPVDPRQIPPDAIQLGAKIATRNGFHRWALEHRAGFTRQMGPNFVYEHLLTSAVATVTPHGLRVNGETFYCDRLHELGLLFDAVDNNINIDASYNPLLASEIYFRDSDRSTWTLAYNIDPEIYKLRASFAEVKEYRARQRLLTNQAELDNFTRRRKRIPAIRKAIKKSLVEKSLEENFSFGSVEEIRENRAQEKANQRSPGLNGALAAEKPNQSTQLEAITHTSQKTASVNTGVDDWDSLWEEVNATNNIR